MKANRPKQIAYDVQVVLEPWAELRNTKSQHPRATKRASQIPPNPKPPSTRHPSPRSEVTTHCGTTGRPWRRCDHQRPKCSAIAFMETRRARISAASAAIRWYTGTGVDQTRSTSTDSRTKVRMFSCRVQKSSPSRGFSGDRDRDREVAGVDCLDRPGSDGERRADRERSRGNHDSGSPVELITAPVIPRHRTAAGPPELRHSHP